MNIANVKEALKLNDATLIMVADRDTLHTLYAGELGKMPLQYATKTLAKMERWNDGFLFTIWEIIC